MNCVYVVVVVLTKAHILLRNALIKISEFIHMYKHLYECSLSIHEVTNNNHPVLYYKIVSVTKVFFHYLLSSGLNHVIEQKREGRKQRKQIQSNKCSMY